MDELGVGLVYFRGFENFLASHSSLIDVVEMEPQTIWYNRDDECDAFKYDSQVMDFLQSYGRPKLFHGVGYPVGGAIRPTAAHFNTLRRQVQTLHPEWISEHLSFNMFNDGGTAINSGFLLPPLQSNEGAAIAAANIRHYQAQMNLPFAFETGTNYLQPRKGEISDGLFVRRVAEQADCNILLDLHNVLANQRNGRQHVKDFFDELPHERIIELHVGGGMYYNDYYLDAHSGTSDRELFDVLRYVITRLPNLKALIFEIDPDSFIKTPETAIVNQLTAMRRLWNKKGIYYKPSLLPLITKPGILPEEPITVSEWERTLGNLVLGKEVNTATGYELAMDNGLGIIKDLVFNFRGSILISMFKLTTRLLRLSVGEELFYDYIRGFFSDSPPELLPVIVAEQFSNYIKSENIEIAGLDKILEYELASVYTAIDRKNRCVNFNFDPLPLFSSLERAMLPDAPLTEKETVLQVVFEKPNAENDPVGFKPVFHN
jgi:uncharacterized protein (UPF0276 family)